jgi:hypothetical protein
MANNPRKQVRVHAAKKQRRATATLTRRAERRTFHQQTTPGSRPLPW